MKEMTDKFECKICNIKFPNNYDLQSHLKIHTVSPYKGYDCDRCSYTALSKKDLKRHLIDHPKYGCSKCGKKFRKQSSLDRHLQFHSDLTITASDGSWFKMDVSKSKKNVLHRCLICSYTTKWKHNLDAHKLRVHEKQKKIKDDAPKQCKNFCGYISVNPKNVRRHEEKCKWSGPGIISVEDVINMVCNTGASFTDTNYIMKLIRTRCGPRAVEPNLVRKIA